MVPDKFNMVDMGGIDLIMMQGEEVPGLYTRLVESIARCRYQCLYNWLFDGVIIPPTYVELRTGDEDEVIINEGVTVTDDDVIHIYSLAPPPPEPEIIPLLAEENGVYRVPAGKDGFNPVTVNVPQSGVNVLELDREPTSQDGNIGDYCISTVALEVTGFCLKIVKAARGSNTDFRYWGTSAFRVTLEDGNGNEVDITELQNYSIWLSPGTLSNNTSRENQLFTNAVSGTYKERNGLPGYIAISADNISNYTLKSFSLCRRQGTSFIDYLVGFDVFWFINFDTTGDSILSISNLTEQDWPNGELVNFSVNKKPEEKKLFYKTELGWVQII